MLQVSLACFVCLTLIWIGEAQYERAIRYWCQSMFAATVTLPILARRFVKSGLPRGPRRDWWKKTCEAVFFAFLTMLLVTAGGVFQATLLVVTTGQPAILGPPSPLAVPPPPPPPPLPASPSIPNGASE